LKIKIMSKPEIINEMINESEKIIERIIELSTFTPEQKKVIESEIVFGLPIKLKLKKTKQNEKRNYLLDKKN